MAGRQKVRLVWAGKNIELSSSAPMPGYWVISFEPHADDPETMQEVPAAACIRCWRTSLNQPAGIAYAEVVPSTLCRKSPAHHHYPIWGNWPAR